MLDITLIDKIVSKNIKGINAFTKRLAEHDGRLNAKYLHKVKEADNGRICLEHVEESEKPGDMCILMGGEVPNSFSPLYEIAYFFQAWLLAGVGTAFLKKADLLESLENPKVSIVCSLDTDIEPYRYVKHQLWRLNPACFKKRCSDIIKPDFGTAIADESLKDIYWVEKDRKIADIAMANTERLSHAKAIQYYLAIKEFLNCLDVDISNIPLFFNFVPREEFLALGPDNEIFSVIAALHNKEFIKLFSKLTRQQYPWIITKACPKCGESSKRIISSHLKADCRTVRAKCSPKTKYFRNEAGITIERAGCGHSFEFQVPDNPKELYQFCKDNDFTVNFPVRELVAVIKTTADSPICWPVTELGIRKDGNGNLYTVDSLPKGFGDHLSLLTSMVTLQQSFVHGKIIPDLVKKFKKKDVLTKKEMLILANISENTLEDKEVTTKDKTGKDVYVKDTSALKALEKGLDVREFFRGSVDLFPFPPDILLALRQGRQYR